jgi:hypothetical protein
MFSGRISNHEKFRLELEQHIETNHVSAQGRDPLKTWDSHGSMAAAELVTLQIEAAPFRPELVDLIARLQAVDDSMRVLVAAMAKTNVLTAPSTS